MLTPVTPLATASPTTGSPGRPAVRWRPAHATAATSATAPDSVLPTLLPPVQPAVAAVQPAATTPTVATALAFATKDRRRPPWCAATLRPPVTWLSGATARAPVRATALPRPERLAAIPPIRPAPIRTFVTEQAAAPPRMLRTARRVVQRQPPSDAKERAVALERSSRSQRLPAQRASARRSQGVGATSKSAAPMHPARWMARRPTATDATRRRRLAATETGL